MRKSSDFLLITRKANLQANRTTVPSCFLQPEVDDRLRNGKNVRNDSFSWTTHSSISISHFNSGKIFFAIAAAVLVVLAAGCSAGYK